MSQPPQGKAGNAAKGRVLVFGSINVDFVAKVRSIARPGETVLSPGYELFFGGKGANQAIAAARAAADDIDVLMCGAVGRDELGEECERNLLQNGVDVSLVQRGSERTGSAFIAIDSKGENAITVAAGANGEIDANAPGDDILGSVRVAVLQMEVPLAENLRITERLRSAGARILLNFAPAADLGPASVRALVSGVDFLIVNEIEATMLAGALDLPGGADKASSVKAIAGALRISVLVTRGGAGVDLVGPDGTTWHGDALPITVVDTTGAGDTFVGIFAAEFASGASPEDAASIASRGASLACRAHGAQAGMPTRAELFAEGDAAAIG